MGAAHWARSAPTDRIEAGWRRAEFHWTDAESGQRLRLSIEGPRDLLERLEEQGFVPLTDDPRLAADGVSEGRAELERELEP